MIVLEEKKQLYCMIRKTWVAASPEEFVRQETLHHLVRHCSFPCSGIVVERDIKSMPHLSLMDRKLPERRADILCYAKLQNEGLHPLLLVECKAVPLSTNEIQQVIGYNYLLKASFIALVNQEEKKLGWFDTQLSNYKFIDYIPSFLELTNSVIY